MAPASHLVTIDSLRASSLAGDLAHFLFPVVFNRRYNTKKGMKIASHLLLLPVLRFSLLFLSAFHSVVKYPEGKKSTFHPLHSQMIRQTRRKCHYQIKSLSPGRRSYYFIKARGFTKRKSLTQATKTSCFVSLSTCFLSRAWSLLR